MNGVTGSDPAPQPSALVVDSDDRQRSLVAGALDRGGFRVHALAAGEHVVRVAEQDQPSLVVLEVHLSDGSGYEVCRALRERFGDTIIILLTSRERTDSSKRVAGFLLGADEYLDKPLAGDELLACVRDLIDSSHEGGVPAASTEGDDVDQRELDVLRLLSRRDDFDGN